MSSIALVLDHQDVMNCRHYTKAVDFKFEYQMRQYLQKPQIKYLLNAIEALSEANNSVVCKHSELFDLYNYITGRRKPDIKTNDG